jgi:hypothetical protein
MRAKRQTYYPVLKQYMMERGIHVAHIMKLLILDYQCTWKRVNGITKISIDEAIQIQETFFPDVPVNELFRHGIDDK